ncbi:WASP protein, partial [Atractosteus spatula]|nr:WASP protein [Atractosteus spatula]
LHAEAGGERTCCRCAVQSASMEPRADVRVFSQLLSLRENALLPSLLGHSCSGVGPDCQLAEGQRVMPQGAGGAGGGWCRDVTPSPTVYHARDVSSDSHCGVSRAQLAQPVVLPLSPRARPAVGTAPRSSKLQKSACVMSPGSCKSAAVCRLCALVHTATPFIRLRLELIWQARASAVVQLWLALPEDRARWSCVHCGVVCLVKDRGQRSFFLRLYNVKKGKQLWEQELYRPFTYSTPQPYFHTFQGDLCQAALNFADEGEAERFRAAVGRRIRRGERRGAEHGKTQGDPSTPQRSDPGDLRPKLAPRPGGRGGHTDAQRTAGQALWNTPLPDWGLIPRFGRRPVPFSPSPGDRLQDRATQGRFTHEREPFGRLPGLAPPDDPRAHPGAVGRPPLPQETDQGRHRPAHRLPASAPAAAGRAARRPRRCRVSRPPPPPGTAPLMAVLHVGHVGWDPETGFDVDHLDPALRRLFLRAGVSEQDLRDRLTSRIIYSVIERRGGLEAVRQELRARAEPVITGSWTIGSAFRKGRLCCLSGPAESGNALCGRVAPTCPIAITASALVSAVWSAGPRRGAAVGFADILDAFEVENPLPGVLSLDSGPSGCRRSTSCVVLGRSVRSGGPCRDVSGRPRRWQAAWAWGRAWLGTSVAQGGGSRGSRSRVNSSGDSPESSAGPLLPLLSSAVLQFIAMGTAPQGAGVRRGGEISTFQEQRPSRPAHSQPGLRRVLLQLLQTDLRSGSGLEGGPAPRRPDRYLTCSCIETRYVALCAVRSSALTGLPDTLRPTGSCSSFGRIPGAVLGFQPSGSERLVSGLARSCPPRASRSRHAGSRQLDSCGGRGPAGHPCGLGQTRLRQRQHSSHQVAVLRRGAGRGGGLRFAKPARRPSEFNEHLTVNPTERLSAGLGLPLSLVLGDPAFSAGRLEMLSSPESCPKCEKPGCPSLRSEPQTVGMSESGEPRSARAPAEPVVKRACPVSVCVKPRAE